MLPTPSKKFNYIYLTNSPKSFDIINLIEISIKSIRLSALLSLTLFSIIYFLCVFQSLTEFIHSSVRYIEMSRTHLQSVDDETFQGLRLKTLKLIDNELQDISERSFRWVHTFIYQLLDIWDFYLCVLLTRITVYMYM